MSNMKVNTGQNIGCPPVPCFLLAHHHAVLLRIGMMIILILIYNIRISEMIPFNSPTPTHTHTNTKLSQIRMFRSL